MPTIVTGELKMLGRVIKGMMTISIMIFVGALFKILVRIYCTSV
jgi:hypothetical protein